MDFNPPLPGEFCIGHAGRAALENRLRTAATFERRLRASKTAIFGSTLPLLDIIAARSGLAPLEYAEKHSLCAFLSRQPTLVAWGAEHSYLQTQVRRSGLKSIRSAACLCRECVAFDLAKRGYSYWRRSHQIPGVYYCQWHGCALDEVENPLAFWRLPHQLVQTSRPSELATSEVVRTSAFVDRYVAATQYLVDMPWSSALSRLPYGVRDAALAQRYRMNPWDPDERPSLTAGAIRLAPTPWLSELYPVISMPDSPRASSPIDHAQQGLSANAQSICIAIATLASSLKEVAEFFDGEHTPGSRTIPYRSLTEDAPAALVG